MRTIEVIATDLEKATEKGLLMLDTKIENVYIKVLEQGSMLKKARIEMTHFDSDGEREQYLFIQQQEENDKKQKQAEYEQRKQNSIYVKVNKNDVKKQLKNNVKKNEYNAELTQTVIEKLSTFMNDFLAIYSATSTCTVSEVDGDIKVNIQGENVNSLIGYHGDTLNAIQLIINQYVSVNFADYGRTVYLDIENYKSKREDILIDKAKKLAIKVLKEKRSLKLEAMNSYERKVVHTALQDINKIDTHSEGVSPNRYLVIDYVG